MLFKQISRLLGHTQRHGQRPGDAAEQLALQHLQQAGLRLVCRNYQARSNATGKLLGEIDLIMHTPEQALVFVEVRERSSARFGGAAVSVTAAKQAKLINAAQHYLATLTHQPPCRFDVIAIDKQTEQLKASTAPKIDWIPNAFDAY